MATREAVMECVTQMKKLPRFQSASDEQKAKAAAYAFDQLHEDAKEFLAFGCSDDDLRHYAKAATKRIHGTLSQRYKGTQGANEFEQSNGFPLLLILGLLPTLCTTPAILLK